MTPVGKTYEFREWLLSEMGKREWTQADLARYADLNRAVINKLLNGQPSTPRPSTLEAIARAFRVPLERVYRVARLLPELSENDDVTEEILHLLNQLKDPKHKSTILLMVKALISEEGESKNRK